MTLLRPLALVAALSLAACQTTGAAPETEPTASPAPGPSAAPAATAAPASMPAGAVLSPDEVARLTALGYVDVSEDAVDEEKMGVVLRDPERSAAGYRLFTNAHLCSTQIVDPDGKVVHAWSYTPCFRWDNAALLPDGDLLVVGRDGKRTNESRWTEGHHLARFSWDGKLRWLRRIKAHHDAQLTPEGNISVLTAEERLLPELRENKPLQVDNLTIVSPDDGSTLEEASLYELLRDAPGFAFEVRRANRDLIHSNSIDWMRRPELAAKHPLYTLGNVLVCMRHQDSIAMIDWRNKKVVWTWGRGELSGPHDAQVLDNGHVLLFDNGVARKWSRVLELDPLTGKIVWQYQAEDPPTFFTLTRGSNQRLANGNTLIADSDSGYAFEVTPDGTKVWEFLNPNLWEGKRGAIVRMRQLDGALVERLLAARGGANG